MKISSRHILKSAEVYGAEATVYTGSNSGPEDFLRFTVGGEWNPGGVQGSTYGKGLYSVYNLDGTGTSRGGYGKWIYKLRVNLYGFISFNEDITQKIYGSKLKPSQQYRMVYGENKLILPFFKKLEKNNVGRHTSAIAEPASKFLRGIVKGVLFTGERDGDVAVIYDANVVTPISYKHLDGDGEWKKFEKEKVKESIGRGMAGSFEPKKYDEDQIDEILRISIKNINSLSGDKSKLDNKSLRYVYFLIKNNPGNFLNHFSEKPWAKEARPELNGKSYVDIAAKASAEREPYYFLASFSEKSWAKQREWAKPYMDVAAKAYAEQNPKDFLYNYSEEPWAKAKKSELGERSYLDLAEEALIGGTAKTEAEQNPFDFLNHFSEKPWAKEARPELNGKSYVDIAAKAYAEQDPFEFLYSFSEKPWAKEARPELNGKSYVDIAAKASAERSPENFLFRFSRKEWAKEARLELEGKSYVDIARKALNAALNAKGLNQTASQVNAKLLKLAGALQNLRSEGLNKEISQIKDLTRNRY